MQKIIIGILAVLFIGLLYLNFGTVKDNQIVKNLDNEKEKTTLTKKKDSKVTSKKEKKKEIVSQEEKNEENSMLTFKDEDLNNTYRILKEKNEPLIVSILLPSYYSDTFVEGLESKFDTPSVQFKRVDVDSNTTNLESLSIYENSDAVILNALQVQDYNDEVLNTHDIESILKYYMAFYNAGMTSIVLSDPNAENHDNLENILLTDQEYMAKNDFYFIDNLSIDSESMYDQKTNTLSTETENQIQNNIKKFLIK